MVEEAIASFKSQYNQGLNALKAELVELKATQTFICNKYDLLQDKYNALTKFNKEQKVEVSKSKSIFFWNEKSISQRWGKTK